jgi:hypothetical protein
LLNDDAPPPLVDCEKDTEDWLRWACFEKRVSRSADLDFFSCSTASAALRFRCVPARVRDFNGLVLGLRVVELGSLEDAVPARVVRVRIGLGLGEAVASALLLLEARSAVAGLAGEVVVLFLFGEGMRNRFRVFLFWRSWSSSESSSTMARLRRFAGGAIAGDSWDSDEGVTFVTLQECSLCVKKSLNGRGFEAWCCRDRIPSKVWWMAGQCKAPGNGGELKFQCFRQGFSRTCRGQGAPSSLQFPVVMHKP